MGTTDDGGAGPRCWLWVAGPDYYLHDGRDHPDLDPAAGFVPTAWWTCDRATRAGDLALLYRSKERRDIAHILVVRSDAEVLDLPASEFHGKYVCSFEVLEKVGRPVGFSTIARDPLLRQWGPVKLRFVRSTFPVPREPWTRLLGLLGRDVEAVAQQARDGLKRVRLEREVQQHLIDRPDLLATAGWKNLHLVRSEYRFENGKRADLVYTQGRWSGRRHVVVELKRGQIDSRAVRQVLDYRDLLDQGSRPLRRPQALLVGDGIDGTAAARVARESRLSFMSLDDLRVRRS